MLALPPSLDAPFPFTTPNARLLVVFCDLCLSANRFLFSPHDEAPEVVNDALADWLKSIGYAA